MNTEIRELQEGIIHMLNGSQLPVEVKRLCVYEIHERLREAGDQAVSMELRRRGGMEAEKTGENRGKGDAG